MSGCVEIILVQRLLAYYFSLQLSVICVCARAYAWVRKSVVTLSVYNHCIMVNRCVKGRSFLSVVLLQFLVVRRLNLTFFPPWCFFILLWLCLFIFDYGQLSVDPLQFLCWGGFDNRFYSARSNVEFNSTQFYCDDFFEVCYWRIHVHHRKIL